MKTERLTLLIARHLIVLLFLSTVGFSLFLAPDLSWPILTSALLRGLLAAGLGWIFFLIVSDTLVKSLLASLGEASPPPESAGLLIHLSADRPEDPAAGIAGGKPPKEGAPSP